MKRITKKVVLVVMCMLMVALVSGCSKSSASEYLKAYLDNAYKKNSETFVKVGKVTEEEALKIREEKINEQLGTVASAVNLTVDQASGLRGSIEDIMFRTKYSIGEPVEQADGSFVVTVTYEQFNIYKPIIEGYGNQANTLTSSWMAMGQTPSQEQMVQDTILSLQSIMGVTTLSAGHDAPQTIDVRLDSVGDTYIINEEDLKKLEYALFDNEEAKSVY